MIRSTIISLALGAIFASSATAQFFTPGNVVVVRVGDPSTTLGSSAAQVFLEEWNPVTGTFVQQVEIPNSTTGASPSFSQRGFSSSEGCLNLTADGRFLVLGGYDRAIGDTDPTAEPAASTPRVIARIDTLTGTIDTSTALTDAYDGNAFRGVASDDGSRFWTSGNSTNGSVRFVSNLGANTSLQINAGSPTNARWINLHRCDLFITSASTGAMTLGPLQVGMGGLPTMSGQNLTLLPGFPMGTSLAQGNPYDTWFANETTVYVADFNQNSTIGGVQRWELVAGTWTFQYRIAVMVGAGTTFGARGISGITRNGVNEITFTAEEPGFITHLYTVADTGPASVPTLIFTEAAETDLRGVRYISTQFSRVTAGCSQADLAVSGAGLVGTDVRTEVCNPAGFPFINYSFTALGLPLTNCACVVAANPEVIAGGPVGVLSIPNNASLVGTVVLQQGIDFLDPAASCVEVPFLTLTDAIQYTIQP